MDFKNKRIYSMNNANEEKNYDELLETEKQNNQKDIGIN